MDNRNEGDEIIIMAIKQSGYNIPDGINSIHQFNAEIIIAIISHCVAIISGGTLEVRLPIRIT